MKLRMTALASAAMATAMTHAAFAEGPAFTPRHPGDGAQPAAAATTGDPFRFNVPTLDRAEAAPSYAQGEPAKPATPAAADASSMPGMDHSKMPGMAEDAGGASAP